MADLTPLVIFGAGGFAREVLELVRDINAESLTYDVIGFLDDDRRLHGTVSNGLPVLGDSSWLERRLPLPAMVLGLGNPALKRRIAERVRGSIRTFPVLIHPSVVMSKYVECGPGVIIAAGNILTCNIRLGEFTLLNLACTVGHDVAIDRFSTIAPGVNVSGEVHIQEGCDVGTGSVVIQRLSIGAWSVIGAGAVVTKDIPANCTAIGVPAKPFKFRHDGWQLDTTLAPPATSND
jgi:sugar O-acyltransferase (sialic acid O-acetyltransferase NeuD family)